MSEDAAETTEPADADATVADDDTTESDTPEAEATDAAVDDASDDSTDAADDAPTSKDDAASKDEKATASSKKAKADAAVAARQTPARRTVTSRRVTPKGGAKVEPTTPSKARDAKKTESVVSRAPVVTHQQVYAKGPSPWWVPAIMFALLIIGALVIMSNYMGVFGDASNIRLVIGLGFILGGIITATQYR